MNKEKEEVCVMRKVQIEPPYYINRDDEMWQKDVPLAEKGINAMIACFLQDYEDAMEISEENFQRYLKFIPESEHELARKLLLKWFS